MGHDAVLLWSSFYVSALATENIAKIKNSGKFNFRELTFILHFTLLFYRLVLEKQEKFDGHQQFFAIVQLIGTRKQAENFAYR